MQKVNRAILTLLTTGFLIINCAYASDPCDQITGAWQGTAKNGACIWDITAVGEIKNNKFELTYYGKSRLAQDCTDHETGTFPGTCTNGIISITKNNYRMNGTISGNNMSLRGTGGWESILELHKVTSIM